MRLDNVRFKEGEGGLLVPHEADEREIDKRVMDEGAKCPAATLGRYTDTGRAYVKCGVEKTQFAVRHSPVAATQWCCGDYAGADGNQFGPCPVWQAMKEKDPDLTRTYAAKHQQAQDELTQRQIAAGIRVDDRGHDPELPKGTREMLEELERSGQ